MSIEGHKEKIISKNTAKDERTSEFEVSKLNGKIDGKIDVYIDEKVNGKPFKYDHHYNITYKFNGPTDVAGANAPGKDDKILLQVVTKDLMERLLVKVNLTVRIKTK